MKILPILPLFFTFMPFFVCTAETPRTCTIRELNDILVASGQTSETLRVTGTVQHAGRSELTLSDASGYATILNLNGTQPSPGTVIKIDCFQVRPTNHDKMFICRQWMPLGSAPIAPPLDLRLDELDEQRHDLRKVTVNGQVVDLVTDEIDTRYRILILKDGAATIPCFVEKKTLPDNLQDAHIQLTGIYHRLVSGFRRFSGPYINITSDISVVTPAPANLLDSPVIDSSNYMTPKEVAKMGRRSLVGTVLATWGGNRAMLRANNTVIDAVFANDSPLPHCGQTVKIAGYPGTNLFRLILSKCVWMPVEASSDKTNEESPQDISPRQVLLGDPQIPGIRIELHGRLIRLRGVVRAIPNEGSGDGRMIVESDGFRVPVDYSSSTTAAEGVTPGCEVEVTGRCLLEAERWQPYEVFPQINGFAVVLRSPADLRVLAHPPWWTPQRLLIVIAALFAALVGIFLWNRVLNRIVERRGRQLLRAEIDRACSEFRVNERTNLAVELHDTISQNLTGVALELNIAGRKAPTNLPVALDHLGLAQRSLASCRQELRNCLWDLRSNALGVASMDEAIRQTLAPNVGDAKLAVRFAVPREHITDNTAHAILRIIRELTVNAIRHGKAKSVRIAGSVENGKLLFSVADDGSGFDPASAPGVPEGHFGLQGIRERVKMFGGSFEIVRRPDGGMRAIVRLPIPQKPKPKGSIA